MLVSSAVAASSFAGGMGPSRDQPMLSRLTRSWYLGTLQVPPTGLLQGWYIHRVVLEGQMRARLAPAHRL